MHGSVAALRTRKLMLGRRRGHPHRWNEEIHPVHRMRGSAATAAFNNVDSIRWIRMDKWHELLRTMFLVSDGSSESQHCCHENTKA